MGIFKKPNDLDLQVYEAFFGRPEEKFLVDEKGVFAGTGGDNPLFSVKKVTSVVEIGRDLQDKIEDLKQDVNFHQTLSDLLKAKQDKLQFIRAQDYEQAAKLRDKTIPDLKSKLANILGLSLYTINNFDPH